MPDPMTAPARPHGLSQADICEEGAVCPDCGYELAGLTMDGVCPECGSVYSREHVTWPDRRRCRRRILLRLGWPLIPLSIAGLCFAAAIATNRFGPAVVGVLLSVVSLGFGTIALLFAIPDVVRRYLRPRERSRSTAANLWRVHPAALLIVIVHLAALLSYGAFLALIAASSH